MFIFSLKHRTRIIKEQAQKNIGSSKLIFLRLEYYNPPVPQHRGENVILAEAF